MQCAMNQIDSIQRLKSLVKSANGDTSFPLIENHSYAL
jgi:hypothetical protein